VAVRPCESHGRKIETRVNSATAVETDFLRVEFVKVMKDAADREAFVVVERFVENAHRNATAIEHEILANKAAGIRQAVGKLFVRGEQQQAWSFRSVRANHDGFRFLQVHVAPFVKVNSARGLCRWRRVRRGARKNSGVFRSARSSQRYEWRSRENWISHQLRSQTRGKIRN